MLTVVRGVELVTVAGVLMVVVVAHGERVVLTRRLCVALRPIVNVLILILSWRVVRVPISARVRPNKGLVGWVGQG